MKDIVIKSFNELTNKEVYEILSARCRVFVVEQNCPYQDADGKDYESYHLYIGDANGRVQAYLRICPPGVARQAATIGRVITVARGCGLGARLMRFALEYAKNVLKYDKIVIGAQVQARGFYEKCGFISSEEYYDEDGIPHVMMYINL